MRGSVMGWSGGPQNFKEQRKSIRLIPGWNDNSMSFGGVQVRGAGRCGRSSNSSGEKKRMEERLPHACGLKKQAKGVKRDEKRAKM